MKNLATCTPTEFVQQTVKIRHVLEKWLTLTDIKTIRKRVPTLTEDMSVEQKKEAIQAQVRKNVMSIFDAVLELHPAETLELLALMCFVEPKDVDTHTMGEYLCALMDMVEDEAVMRFFSLSSRLGQMGILPGSKQ